MTVKGVVHVEKKQTFGSRLKAMRKERGYSSAEALADAAGITRQSIGKYEKEERRPDIIVLRSLARALGVSSDYLLGLSEAKSPNETIQGIHREIGLSEKAIVRLSVDTTFGENYIELLSALIAHDSFPKLLQVLGNYLENDKYLDGCADEFISQLTQYDNALDEHLARKAIYKKIAEEYLWKIVDEYEED